jgi:carbon monoxide dehydrogenase subunit G
MASIRKEIPVSRPPAEAWDAVRDAGAVHRRLLPGFITDARLDGDTRVCTVNGAGELREQIVDIDDDARRIAYTVVGGPLPTTHHNASMEVVSDGAGGSVLVWTTDFLPSELAGPIGELVDAAATVIATTLSKAPQAAAS